MPRKYPLKDVKMLFGRAAMRCAFPDCRKICMEDATDYDDPVVKGHIAHIFAHGATGPRANPQLTAEETDCYNNWVLLCLDHHSVVDKQVNTYPTDRLIQMKTDHEYWVDSNLQQRMPDIGFAELEVTINAIIAAPSEPTTDFRLISPNEKIAKNNLSKKIAHRIQIGLMKSDEVKKFLESLAAFDPNFPEKVSNGFVQEYNRLLAEGLRGDELFYSMHDFSSGRSTEFDKQSAGLAVLVYLFERCEVFEK